MNKISIPKFVIFISKLFFKLVILIIINIMIIGIAINSVLIDKLNTIFLLIGLITFLLFLYLFYKDKFPMFIKKILDKSINIGLEYIHGIFALIYGIGIYLLIFDVGTTWDNVKSMMYIFIVSWPIFAIILYSTQKAIKKNS